MDVWCFAHESNFLFLFLHNTVSLQWVTILIRIYTVSCNTYKDKWSLNEFIFHNVQEEEMIEREKTESTHIANTSKR